VFKNTVLKKVLRPKGWKITGGWRILHSEKLQDEKSLPNIILVTISGRMRWVGHVVRIWTDQKVSDQNFIFFFKQEGAWGQE
jgi:hypothetical protein